MKKIYFICNIYYKVEYKDKDLMSIQTFNFNR